ncbi:MAG: hypothetical protein ACE5Z5_01180 [Candidatus Bathyarchaeia archaeon]
MKPETHKRIARRVSSKLGRPDLATIMEESSVLPDDWRDFPHHTTGGNVGKIIRYVLAARKSFIKGNEARACEELGIAFHYVADDHVLIRGTSEYHIEYERETSRAKLHETKPQILEGKNQTLNFIRSNLIALSMTTFILDAEEALNRSYRTCLPIAVSVFGPKFSSILQKELQSIASRYREHLQVAEFEYVDRLLKLVSTQEKASHKKGIARILYWFVEKIYKYRIKTSYNSYKRGKQFSNLLKSYHKEANRTAAQYADWYKVTIPSISPSQIQKELLNLPEVGKHLKESEQALKELLTKRKIPSYIIGDQEFIRVSDLGDLGSKYVEMRTQLVDKQPVIEMYNKYVPLCWWDCPHPNELHIYFNRPIAEGRITIKRYKSIAYNKWRYARKQALINFCMSNSKDLKYEEIDAIITCFLEKIAEDDRPIAMYEPLDLAECAALRLGNSAHAQHILKFLDKLASQPPEKRLIWKSGASRYFLNTRSNRPELFEEDPYKKSYTMKLGSGKDFVLRVPHLPAWFYLSVQVKSSQEGPTHRVLENEVCSIKR